MVCELKTITIDGRTHTQDIPPGCSNDNQEEDLFRSYETCANGVCRDDYNFQQYTEDKNEILKNLEEIKKDQTNNDITVTGDSTTIETTREETQGRNSRDNAKIIVAGVVLFVLFIFSIGSSAFFFQTQKNNVAGGILSGLGVVLLISAIVCFSVANWDKKTNETTTVVTSN